MGEIDVTPSSRALESDGATATPLPSRPPQAISAHLTLQAPLSRRGNGPGLILVVDHYAPLDASEKSLDPPPLIKWAEEGFAVIQVLVPGKVDDGGEFPLEKAIECLKGCEGCDTKEGEGFGLISYLTRIPFYVEEAVCLSPHVAGIVSYGGRPFSSISPSTPALPPQLIHIAGPDTPRRSSISVVPDSPPLPSTSRSSKLHSHRYLEAKKDAAWILPADDDYHAPSAALAHTRSLAFLKPLLGGPWFDLEAVWDEHCLYEFVERDVDKTMATMVAQPYVNHIPTMTGGIGQEKLRDFYANHFIHSNPPSTNMTLVSRTIGTDRIIDEFTFSLTHDRQVDWLLPGVPPTHKQLNIPFVSVVALRGDRLCHEHIHWDQATALRQAGLLPEYVPFEGKVEGAEGQRVEVRLPVAGVETARKLVDEGYVESNGLMGKGWRAVDGVKEE